MKNAKQNARGNKEEKVSNSGAAQSTHQPQGAGEQDNGTKQGQGSLMACVGGGVLSRGGSYSRCALEKSKWDR